MRLAYRILPIGLGIIMMASLWQPKVSAQATSSAPSIIFNNFHGTYYLSRDAQGRSLLTTEEVILADFPGNGSFYGITRSIPKRYQNQLVGVKVLTVTDAAGTAVPYKTVSDKDDNLVLTTGDPAITLYGQQTFRISYQTRDVVNLNLPQNQFLLDINGRGWGQSFEQVSATVHVPHSFSSSLVSKPICYIGYLNTVSYECSIDTQTLASEALITSKALNSLGPRHSLIVKLDFKTATFNKVKSFWTAGHTTFAVGLAGIVLGAFWFKNYRKALH